MRAIKYLLSLLFIIAIISIFLPFNIHKVNAKEKDDFNEIIDDLLDGIDFDQLDEYLDFSNNGTDFKDFVKKVLNGEEKFDYNSFFNYIFSQIFSKIRLILPKFFSILAIALLYKLIIGVSIENDDVKKVVYYVCMTTIIIIVSSIITDSIVITKNSINKINDISNVLFPIILTLTVLSGGKASAGFIQPAILVLSQIISGIIINGVLPMIKVIVLLNLVSSVVPELKLNGIITFFNSVIKWIMGLTFTIYSSILTIHGITIGNIDGISLRVTKYAISNSVPIIGGYVSGGFELIVAGSVLIKNSIGYCGIFIVLFNLISPLLFLIILSLIFKLFAGILSVVSDDKLSSVLTSISKSVSLMIMALVGVYFMFFNFIYIVMSMSNSFI